MWQVKKHLNQGIWKKEKLDIHHWKQTSGTEGDVREVSTSSRCAPCGIRDDPDTWLTAAAEMAETLRIHGPRKLKEHVADPVPRGMISRILTSLGMFVVDSPVKESLKADTGRKKVRQILQELYLHRRPTPSLNDKKKPEELKLVMEELQVKESIEEDMNRVEQGSKISAKSVKGLENPQHLKGTPNEGNKETDLLETDKKKVFIRSRL